MKKTIVITGATGAIGGATALELAKQKHHLILIGRSAEKLKALKQDLVAKSGNNEIETVEADLGEPDSVKAVAASIRSKNQSIDALLNIAAVYRSQRGINSKKQELTFATNHLGPFNLSNELLPALKSSSSGRIVTVTAPSTTKVNFDDINSEKKYSAGFMGSFGSTKMMNLLFTYHLADKVKDSKISAMAFHPGLVKSELTSQMPAFLHWLFKNISSPPDKAAQMLSKMATDDQYSKTNGKFIKFDGKELKSSAYSYDKKVQEDLWALSEKQLGH